MVKALNCWERLNFCRDGEYEYYEDIDLRNMYPEQETVSFGGWVITNVYDADGKVLDIPDKRKVHLQPIPSMGGLAFFFSFLLGYMLFAPKTDQMLAILMGSFLIIIVGIIDDISPLRPLWKLLGQVVASLIVVIYGGITFSDMTIFGFSIKFPLIS